VAAALGGAALLLGVGVFLVTARLLTRGLSKLSSLPDDLFTRRIGRAFLSALVVSVILAVALPLGFALLFVPGLFPTVSLQFALFAVAVEDTSPIDALRRSWEPVSGNRWRLLALVVLFGILGGIGGVVGSLFAVGGTARLARRQFGAHYRDVRNSRRFVRTAAWRSDASNEFPRVSVHVQTML
jgi:hypothetical protein